MRLFFLWLSFLFISSAMAMMGGDSEFNTSKRRNAHTSASDPERTQFIAAWEINVDPFGAQEFSALQSLGRALSLAPPQQAQALIAEAAEFLKGCGQQNGTTHPCDALTLMQTHFLFADYPFISVGCARQLYHFFRNQQVPQNEKAQRLSRVNQLQCAPPQMLSRLKHALYMSPSQQAGRPATTHDLQPHL